MLPRSSLTQIATAIVVVSVASEVMAQSAPAALRGKSIIVSWTENRQQRFEGDPVFKPAAVSLRLQIYVSAEGRTFERLNVAGASKERVEGGATTSARSRFQGSTLITSGATRGHGGGARQVAVTFDAGFANCSARVTVGREPGAAFVKGTHMGLKRPIEFQMQGITGESCSIQSGNVFAQ